MTLHDQARAILRGNDRGGYTIPTDGLYPYQWNWDSAYAAWGFSTFDLDRAWEELHTLISGQWDTGMIPHIIFHKQDPRYFPGPEVWGCAQTPPTSGISQPPVAAIMAHQIWQADPKAAEPHLPDVYARLLSWHRWFMTSRLRDGVICVTHPWESGRDNCPDWDVGMANVDGGGVGPYQRRDLGHVDASMRPSKEEYDRYVALVKFGRACNWDQDTIMHQGPFVMGDPGTHFILMRANTDLAAIGAALGEDTAEIDAWQDILRAGAAHLWNDELEAYDARDMITGQFAHNLSSASFLAFLAGVERPELEDRLMRAWDGVTYGIPSADPRADRFDPRRYWRGPSWPFLNALIAMGLDASGRPARAERLRQETRALILSGGFYEYFDPVDATPCGGKDFTWTAAIWLTWAGRDADLKEGAA